MRGGGIGGEGESERLVGRMGTQGRENNNGVRFASLFSRSPDHEKSTEGIYRWMYQLKIENTSRRFSPQALLRDEFVNARL